MEEAHEGQAPADKGEEKMAEQEANGFIRRHEFEVSEKYNEGKHHDMDRDVESLSKRTETEINASKTTQNKLHDAITDRFKEAINKADAVDVKTTEKLEALGTKVDDVRKETILAASNLATDSLMASKDAQSKTYELEKNLTNAIAETKIAIEQVITATSKETERIINKTAQDFQDFKMKMVWWVLGIVGTAFVTVSIILLTIKIQ